MQICVKRTQPFDYHNQKAYSPKPPQVRETSKT